MTLSSSQNTISTEATAFTFVNPSASYTHCDVVSNAIIDATEDGTANTGIVYFDGSCT